MQTGGVERVDPRIEIKPLCRLIVHPYMRVVLCNIPVIPDIPFAGATSAFLDCPDQIEEARILPGS